MIFDAAASLMVVRVLESGVVTMKLQRRAAGDGC